MSKRAERYKKRATDCEAAAQKLTDNETRRVSLDLAHQWRELARQAEMLGRDGE